MALEQLDANREDHQQILMRANFIKVTGAVDSDFNSVRQLIKKLGDSLDD